MEPQCVKNKVSREEQIHLRLEWTRRSVAEYVTEINNIQVFGEAAFQKIAEKMKNIEVMESKLIKGNAEHDSESEVVGIEVSSDVTRTDPSPTPSLDDNTYMSLYLAKLYADLAVFIEMELFEEYMEDDTLHTGRLALIRPVFNIIVDLALRYLKVANLAYQNRFTKTRYLKVEDLEIKVEDSYEQINILKSLLEENLASYKSKYDDKLQRSHSSRAGIGGAAYSSSSLESLGTDPSSADHTVPLYFRVYVHENKKKYWNYLSPMNRALMAQSSNHLPPSKLVTLALHLVCSDILDLAYPKRNSGKSHDLILEHAQMYGTKLTAETKNDVSKIVAHYSQMPIRAFLSQCKFHLQNRIGILQFKFTSQCHCGRLFHLQLVKVD